MKYGKYGVIADLSMQMHGWTATRKFQGDIPQDPEGTVYLLDNEQQQQQLYDAVRSYERTIGKPNQDPGERADSLKLADAQMAIIDSFNAYRQ